MPSAPHHEQHFTASAAVRDVVIGISDGLTVPFALAAGLTGAIAASKVVVTAGMAEIAAGAISMGLGGYLAARSDEDHYASELKREELEIIERREDERQEVRRRPDFENAGPDLDDPGHHGVREGVGGRHDGEFGDQSLR